MKNYPYYKSEDIKNLRDLIACVKQKWGANDAFRLPDEKGGGEINISFEAVAADVEAAGTALLSAGLGGKRCVVMGNNCYGWALAYFAAANSGGCVVPVDPELPAADIRNIITKTQAEVLFYAGSCAEKADEILDLETNTILKYVFSIDKSSDGGIRTVFDLAAEGRALLEKGDDSFSRVEIHNNAVCAIIYTSGTSGTPKGVMLSHANIASNVAAAVKAVHFAPGDVFLSVLPYHHTYECTCGLMVVMLWGACICFNDSIRNIQKNLARYKPTAMLMVPLYIETFYKKIMDNIKNSGAEKKFRTGLKLSGFLRRLGVDKRAKFFGKILEFFGGRLKTVVCGGAYLRPDYVKLFGQIGIQVLQGYGITECSPLVAVNRNKCWKFDSAGMPIPCCQVKIAGGKKSGEILIKGTNVMLGYYEDPARTAEAFEGDWYKSGDIGHVGKNNFIYITGRKANMIVFKNGKNVAPEELESELTKNDVIKEVVVLARSDRDGVRDLFAYIKVYEEFAEKHGALSVYEEVSKIIGEFNSSRQAYSHIKDFALIKTEFPKTTSKKIIRYKVGENADV